MEKHDALTKFASRDALQAAAADWIANALADAISRRGRAVFMASGGRTPGPVYTALSKRSLNWGAVTVGLTDERWVAEDHPASNGALVRRTLITGKAAKATFMPMKRQGDEPFSSVRGLDEDYRNAAFNTDIMLLGMGPDAHTLSWFAGAKGYAGAIDPSTSSSVAGIDAPQSDVTGPDTARMTLTHPCVARARSLLLLITGADKLAVLERAEAGTPLAIMRKAAGHALTIFYAP